jgi:hypothetical protein
VKLLLIPLAIAAFVVFLLILGAIGLAIAMTVIAAVGKLWRLTLGRRAAARPTGPRSI